MFLADVVSQLNVGSYRRGRCWVYCRTDERLMMILVDDIVVVFIFVY